MPGYLIFQTLCKARATKAENTGIGSPRQKDRGGRAASICLNRRRERARKCSVLPGPNNSSRNARIDKYLEERGRLPDGQMPNILLVEDDDLDVMNVKRALLATIF